MFSFARETDSLRAQKMISLPHNISLKRIYCFRRTVCVFHEKTALTTKILLIYLTKP